MWLAELNLTGFRNISQLELEFDSEANVVFGPNGAGKTNILEAIAVLASGRSFRTLHDRELLGFGATHYGVAGRARNRHDKEWSARVYFSPAERKHYFLDRREIPKRSLYTGWLPVSVFLLDDRRVIGGPPAQRRAFLDEAVGKLSRPYRWMLSEFRRVLAQRNALLKRGGQEAEFVVWETRLAELACEIQIRRMEYWQKFIPHFSRAGKRFLPAEELNLEYLPDVSDVKHYAELLARSREADRRLGVTRHGPHRDDFRILLNMRPLRAFGSYGQQRLTALALSLAEAETVLAAGRRPLYLMDDVAAELDDANTHLLLELIRSKGQVFYAAARPPQLQARRFYVKEGKARQV